MKTVFLHSIYGPIVHFDRNQWFCLEEDTFIDANKKNTGTCTPNGRLVLSGNKVTQCLLDSINRVMGVKIDSTILMPEGSEMEEQIPMYWENS